MNITIEAVLAYIWNKLIDLRGRKRVSGTNLGTLVSERAAGPLVIPQAKRTEHITVLGKTGSGKSFLLRHLAAQDIRRRQGFCFFDLHGDATPALLSFIGTEEGRSGEDLSRRVVVIEPGDDSFSVGMNVLESAGGASFVQIAEFARVLKQRWHLDSFGPRTEELLRNALWVVSECGYTILEVSLLLTNHAFRIHCLQSVSNPEVKAYFQRRYGRASEGMLAILSDAVLNKISGFTVDPKFRHLLGQRRSTFSLPEAVEKGYWIIVNLNKGELGEQAPVFGSLFLTRLKGALFARKSRAQFGLYCDEIQNIVSFDSGLEELLSEARKFGVAVTSANQFLDQYPQVIRSALLSTGTQVFFQLSSADAEKCASALGAGRGMAETLRNLPKRQFVAKIGESAAEQAEVPMQPAILPSWRNLYIRSRQIYARPRAEIEGEIRNRTAAFEQSANEVLNEWA